MKGFYYNKNKVYYNGIKVPQHGEPRLHYGEIPETVVHTYTGLDAIENFIKEKNHSLGIWSYETEFRKKIKYRMSTDDWSKTIKPNVNDVIEWTEYALPVEGVSVRCLQELKEQEFAEWCRDNGLGIMESNKTQVL